MSLQDLSAQQLTNTISQLHVAAANISSGAVNTPYQKNLLNWSTTATAPPRTASSGTRSTRARTTRSSAATPLPQPLPPPVAAQMQMPINYLPAGPQYPPPNPIPASVQGYLSTYPSRLRTGVTLLMQPIFSAAQASTSRASRRGGAINYADPGSGDDIPDAGALDSDDSDFVSENRLGGRQRTTTRARMAPGMSVFNATTGVTTMQPAAPPPPARPEKAELDQSYLGMVPPARFITAKGMMPTPHVYHDAATIEKAAVRRASLVPIRVEFETDTHRIRDCFVWNLNEGLITPENFARIFCADLDLPLSWVETVTNQIRAQLEEHETIARLELTQEDYATEGEELPECRVILSIDVQIANHHLLDHIEWDLLSPLTPEALGLTGEAVPLIAHAIHEELMKHKKDAVEWGVVDGGGMRDKTGLGLGSVARGRGPKALESVWRDWQEADEFRTRFEVLSAEEVERREIERERASRRLRRETSKFQSARRRRY
ncbi:hypothetical protein C8J57DRAFT_1314732 [Mycena rebaudengoi]|nr:hypothetical protein C8J57DRAFT_1314732 [Mycena rebaudengoi]